MTTQTASSQSRGGSGMETTLQELEQSIVHLEDRLEKLEALAAMDKPNYFQDAPKSSRPSSPRPRRIMILQSVEPLDVAEDAREQLAQLQKEADALEKSVEQMKRKTTSLEGSGRGG